VRAAAPARTNLGARDSRTLLPPAVLAGEAMRGPRVNAGRWMLTSPGLDGKESATSRLGLREAV